MTGKVVYKILFFLCLLQIAVNAQNKQIVAYFPEWGVPEQNYFVKDIFTSGSGDKITTLIFAFIEPKPDSSGNIIPGFMHSYYDYRQVYSSGSSIDGLPDDSAQALRGEFNQLRKLKIMYPDLKILISIGGWTGSTYYSDIALTKESREKFVDACINEFILGNLPADSGAGGKGSAAGLFDGFDLDWEFPVSGGIEGIHHNKDDMENYSELIASFRKKLDAVDSGLILTAAIPADKPNIGNYDIRKDEKYLNWYNVMTYDFHGGWDKVAAHQTNLFSSPEDTTDNGARRSLDKSVKYLLDTLGIKPSKIIPGAAFYGRGWQVSDSVNYGLYQPGKPAEGEREAGIDNYRYLLPLMKEGYEYHWDSTAMAPWLYSPAKKIFWSFDDPKSIALKARYADAYNLGGLMFWEISGDDSAGTLVKTIYNRNMPDIKIETSNTGESIAGIKITEPKSGVCIYEHSNLILTAKQSGGKGSIKKVEFFADDSSLGYVTYTPFSWVWFNVRKGKHKVSAVATDGSGNKTFAGSVVVYVKERKNKDVKKTDKIK